MTNKQDLLKILIQLAAIYDKELSDELVEAYYLKLRMIPLPHLMRAYELYTDDSRNRFFPLPAVLINLSDPNSQVSNGSLADDIAARITSSIRRHGYTWPDTANNWPVDAIEELGELGWTVVKKLGGWIDLCQEDIDPGIARAQYRRIAASVIEQAQHGTLNIPPALPESKQKKVKSEGLVNLGHTISLPPGASS